MTASKSAKADIQSKPKIMICKNGPYLVTGNVPLQLKSIRINKKTEAARWEDGKSFKVPEEYALCRCGHSADRPFCDGTHEKIKFRGAETAATSSPHAHAKIVDGPTLEAQDAECLCAAARFCHEGGNTWNLVAKSGNSKARALARKEAMDCPSGRLVITDKKTGSICEPSLPQSIVAVEDPSIGVSGPLWVRGEIPIESAGGKTYHRRNRVTLCRCGKSKNKPFCDSRHWRD
jgi:CDGSH-type Zn-finger protein